MNDRRSLVPSNIWRELRKMIYSAYNLNELRTLCFDLGIEYEDLGGAGRQERVISIIETMNRQGQIEKLLSYLRQERPNVNWPSQIPANSETDLHFIPHRFQALINEKTRDFVGRDYVFDAIDNFISHQPNGYIEVEGDPGVGKSAILAEYMQRRDIIAHFNIQSQGINTTRHFLESVCTQLIDRYQLPYTLLPTEATQDGSFLAHLLDEASSQLAPDEQLIIGVDALDEVEKVGTGTNILYLPYALPEKVYFLLTRRKEKLPLIVHTPYKVIDLMVFEDEGLEDIQTYIQQALAERPRLKEWLKAHSSQLSEEGFNSTLANRSEHNFMYLRYVLQDIENGVYSDLTLDTLPVGLEGYYEDHWRRMGMLEQPIPATKLKIVYILSEVKLPVSRELVADFAKESAVQVQQVLDEWKQFLHEDRSEEQGRYSIYHTSFRDFLHRRDIVQAAGIDLQNIHEQIADNLWRELFDDDEPS